MSATLGEGGELERITGIRKIERLPVPEGWDKQGPGRRFIMFPDLSLPAETSKASAITLAGEPVRSLILTPNRNTSRSVIDELRKLSPSPSIPDAQVALRMAVSLNPSSPGGLGASWVISWMTAGKRGRGSRSDSDEGQYPPRRESSRPTATARRTVLPFGQATTGGWWRTRCRE